MRITDRRFFEQEGDALAVALLGKLLCRAEGDEIVKYEICETECYMGVFDTACHASRGKTKRTEVLWKQGGTVYVYLIYGLHLLLNIISGKEGDPQGVLIRGVVGATGPGRASKALGITMDLKGEDVLTSDRIWIEDVGKKVEYTASKRVGIEYAAEKDRESLWRFIAK